MEITYQLTQKDFTESFSAHANRRSWARRFKLILFWSMVFFCAFLLFGAMKAGNTRTLLPFFGLMIVWFAVLGGLPMWWSARRQFLKQPAVHGPRTVSLDAAGTHSRWNGGSSDVEWKNYIRFVESENQFLLYTSPACFNIIPKRALEAEQQSELRALLGQHISAAKRAS